MRSFTLLTVLSLVIGGATVFPPVKLVGAPRRSVKADPAPKADPTPAPTPTPQPTPDPVPELSLPTDIVGDVDTFIKIVADTNGEHVRWVAMDKGLAVFPGEMLK